MQAKPQTGVWLHGPKEPSVFAYEDCINWGVRTKKSRMVKKPDLYEI
jgi:hypothetical protein